MPIFPPDFPDEPKKSEISIKIEQLNKQNIDHEKKTKTPVKQDKEPKEDSPK